MISYFQAIVIGILQGVTELFPVSSLGHSVLIPAWLGWDGVVSDQSRSESPYLAFVVMLHVATALALLVYFRAEWARIIKGFFHTLKTRKLETPDERMAWLLIVATIPAGLTGILLEHSLRTLFAKPLAAAIFLTINGLMLLFGDWVRRRRSVEKHHRDPSQGAESHRRGPTPRHARLPRSGRGRRRADRRALRRCQSIGHHDGRGPHPRPRSRRRGALLVPAGDADHPRRGPLQAPRLHRDQRRRDPRSGDRRQRIFAAGAAFISVRFLVRFFRTRNLLPFAIYCLIVGGISIVHFA